MSDLPTLERFDSWLDEMAREDDYPCISIPRRFQHDESAYDAQYGNEPLNFECGHGAIKFVREMGVESKGIALEIGCGTGLMSLGMVDSKAYRRVLLTDPSPQFLRITEDKLKLAGVPKDEFRLGLFSGEDLNDVPEDMFSLIAMRSTLHHVLDVELFLSQAARALQKGGALVFQEPCREGYVLMGALAQFLPVLSDRSEEKLSEEQREKLDVFVNTMQFYARRDLDKSKSEDKHVFRVDELMQWSSDVGLKLRFVPNRTFEHFNHHPESRPLQDRFRKFFYDYLKYCMSFDETMLKIFDQELGSYCDWLDTLSDAASPPYMHGVFIAERV